MILQEKVAQIRQGLHLYFSDQECRRCQPDIYCIQAGHWTGHPAPAGQVFIYNDNRPILRTNEKIGQCPVIRGERTVEENVKHLQEIAPIALNNQLIRKVGNY